MGPSIVGSGMMTCRPGRSRKVMLLASMILSLSTGGGDVGWFCTATADEGDIDACKEDDDGDGEGDGGEQEGTVEGRGDCAEGKQR